jgi:PAS domain S-box-containing protein
MGRRGLSLRWRLMLLVLAAVVPLLVFTAGHQYSEYVDDIAATGTRTMTLAHSMAALVEEELQARVASLETLASSGALRRGDLDAVRIRAEAVVAEQFPGSNILLLAPDGQVLMSTVIPTGQKLPVRRNLESTDEVLTTGRPAVSNLFYGALRGQPVIAIDVPVRDADGKITYVLSMNPPLDQFSDVMRRQHLPGNWLYAIFDRQGITIARFPNGEQLVGTEASPRLLPLLRGTGEGHIENNSREGIPLVVGYSHGDRFGWAVAIGVPRAELTGPVIAGAIRTLSAGSVLLVVGLGLAAFAARGIARPIESLRRLAAHSDRDALPVPTPTGLPEVDEVAQALYSAEDERRRSRQAELILRDAIDTMPEGFVIYDDQTRLVICNQSYRNFYPETMADLAPGVTFEEILRDGVARGRFPAARGREEEWIAERVRRQREPQEPLEQRLADGRWVFVTKHRLANNWVVGLRIDITALKMAEQALRESEARLALAVEIAEIGLASGELGADWATVNRQFNNIYGRPRESAEVSFGDWVRQLQPEDRDRVADELRQAVGAGKLYRGEFRISRLDTAEERWISIAVQPYADPAGGPGRILAVNLDITDLRKNLHLLEAAMDVAELGSWVSDITTDSNTEGRLDWSPGSYRICGISEGDFDNRVSTFWNMVHLEDRLTVADARRNTIEHGEPYRVEHRIIRPDGAVRWVHQRGEIIRDAAGKPIKLAGVIQDVTDRRAAEHMQAYYAAIVESTADAIIATDLNGIVTSWNEAAEAIFGYSASEMVGEPIIRLLPADRLDEENFILAKIRRGEKIEHFETMRRRKSGAEFPASLTISPILGRGGEIIGASKIVRDITERRQTEGQLRQAQKMEAIGNLTGGMAHDFNNLLGVVVGNLDLANEQAGDNEDMRELISEALEAAWRGADLTRRLLAFARRQPLRPARIDVNDLVSDTVRLLRRLLGEDIEVSLNLGADVWPVTADPAQLEASLANLATNARDAMPRGGRLIIETQNRYLDADYAATHAEVAPGDFVMIEVSDTGLGMKPEMLSQIFEPFFTTKEAGKGTGLGLSMVFGFLKQSGGHVNVYSEPGVGTTFRLYLPRATAEGTVRDAADARPLARGAGEIILLVEDNTGMRRIAQRQLRDLGYRVLECDRAATALETLQREPVDLLLTDIVMPGGLDGVELSRIAHERWPRLKIILTSGFPQARVEGDGEVAATMTLLSKPYHKEELATALRTALDG